MKNWHNTDELDELLGSELDLDQAWSEFKKDKKKTRRIPFWWCFGLGSILLLGMIGYFGNFINLKMNGQETAAILLHPSAAVPAFELPSQKVEEKQTINPIETTTFDRITKSETDKAKVDHRSLVRKNTSSLDQITASGWHPPFAERNNKVAATIIEKAIQEPSKTKALLIKKTKLEVSSIAALQSLLVLPQLEKIPAPNHTLRPPFNSKKWKVGIQYTLANAQRGLSGGTEEYTQRRQEEQFQESNRLELFVTRNLSSHLFFQTGLALTQFRSKLVEDIQTINSPVQYEDVVTETHTQNNITEEIIGIAEGSQLAINRFTRFQRYQSFSIPLRLGVRVPLHSHWSLSASSGIAISLYNQTNGLTFSSASPDGEYKSLSQLGYRKGGVLEGMGQLSIERSFGNTTLSLGAQGTIDLNNRLKTADLGVDKFRSYGIQFGIHRSF